MHSHRKGVRAICPVSGGGLIATSGLILVVLVGLAAPGSPASGGSSSAAIYKKGKRALAMEVHTEPGRIFFLYLRSGVRCETKRGKAYVRSLRTSTRVAIHVNRSTGVFRFVESDRGRDWSRLVIAGTVRNRIIVGRYRYRSYDSHTGRCGTGATLEGSAVHFAIPRVRGVTFYRRLLRRKRIYLWAGRGRIYGLFVQVRTTCVDPPDWADKRRAWAQLEVLEPVRYNRRTGRFRYADAVRGAWEEDWEVIGRITSAAARGRLGYTYDFSFDSGSGSSYSTSCWTGRSQYEPEVGFSAPRR